MTARDVELKQTLLQQAVTAADHLLAIAIADAVTGVGLRAATVKHAKKREAEFAVLWSRVALSEPDQADVIRAAARRDLDAGLPVGTAPRRPLHWPVVFPEVFAEGPDPGFDAVIGNPPFLGGKKISGALGDDYLAWLQRWDGNGVKGNADLAARFVLRANALLNARGQLGFVTTNTIVQGDTLEVGLGQAASKGLTVRRGRSSHPWPSASASLEIVELWASRAPVAAAGLRVLDGEDVPSIGADLEPVGRVAGRPYRLAENEDVAFQGSNVLGLGFTLTHEQAAELIARDPRNADCLQPYVIGQDLNQRPDHSASRWIINFREWPLGRVKTYPDLYDIVERLVKPERMTKDPRKYPRMVDEWWKFWQNRHGMAGAIADLDHVLAVSRVGNAILPVRVRTGPVFSEAAVVFALDASADLAMLSSSLHSIWVIRYTSTLETRIRYAPSDVFLTLPRPPSTALMAKLGEDLDSFRRDLMLSRAWGLTTTYNHVHSPLDRDPEVVRLREIHEAIDHAVLYSYGWSDLDPQIGHHSTKIGTRWTVSREARFELLDRLLEENHRRHALEQSS